MEHYSVMKQECLDLLDIKEDGIYVDATLGRAGHSSAILKKIKNGKLFCFDLDLEAIEKSNHILSEIASNYKIFYSNYCFMQEKLLEEGIDKVDGILMDLGVSSPQFDEGGRGFSYRYNSRLDMRMDINQSLDAYQVVNEYSFENLSKIFFEYGEEKFSKSIARNIEKAREIKPIETTFELVEIIKSSLPSKVVNSKGHPAKKVFQAIRIEVNNELKSLEIAIEKALELLNVGGRLCVITFHSLEDRIVKQAFSKVSKKRKVDPRLPMIEDENLKFKLINKNVVMASEKELNENHRSHSAKLRVIERIAI